MRQWRSHRLRSVWNTSAVTTQAISHPTPTLVVKLSHLSSHSLRCTKFRRRERLRRTLSDLKWPVRVEERRASWSTRFLSKSKMKRIIRNTSGILSSNSETESHMSTSRPISHLKGTIKRCHLQSQPKGMIALSSTCLSTVLGISMSCRRCTARLMKALVQSRET